MAAKRMFSIDVIDTDKFLDMPVSTQALYFHFGMRADDDGFVSSPKKIVKIANCTNDDLRILISKKHIRKLIRRKVINCLYCLVTIAIFIGVPFGMFFHWLIIGY